MTIYLGPAERENFSVDQIAKGSKIAQNDGLIVTDSVEPAEGSSSSQVL